MPPLPTALQAGYYYDSDGDGFDDTYVPDPWEDPAYYGYSTPPSDQDGDGWEDSLDPFPADARLNPQTDPDADGVPSELEWFYGMNDLDPADGAADLDGDGFSNAEAFQQGWVLDAALVSPVPDLDGDRLNDITEAHWAQVHPGSLDPANPLDPVADYDQDGVMNFEELTWGLDLASPTSPATGEDLAFMQLVTGDYAAFVIPGYPGYSATDPDADGLPSLLEYQLLLNPRSADSDEDGLPDGEEDTDGDGFGNLAEVAAGTLPGQAASHPEASPAGGTGGDGSGSTNGTGNEQGNGNGTTGSAVPPVGGTALAATTDLHLRVRSLKVSGGTITRHSQEEWIYTSGSANQSEDMAALTADGWLVDFYTTEVPTGTDPDGLPTGYETWYWWNAKKQVGVAGETILPFSGPSGELASDQAVSEAYADEPGQVYQEDVSGELNLNNPGSGDVFAGWEEGGGVKVVSEFAASKQSTPVSDTGLYPQGEAAEVWVEGSASEVAQRKTYLILGSSTMFQWAPVWQGAGTVTFILEPGMTGVGRVEAMTGAPPWVSVHNGRLWVEPPVEQGMRNMVRLSPVDIDIDSDNNNGFEMPDRSSVEEVAEDVTGDDQKPGKVILVNDYDNDRDGIPDFTDGYEWSAGLSDESSSEGNRFVPLVVSIPTEFENAKIRFAYDSSNPLQISASQSDLFELPPGRLRIWKKNGDENRDGKEVSEGGDWLASNKGYAISDLDFNANDLLVLYVEAVQASQSTADLTIKLELQIDSNQSWIECGQIRITATKLEILGRPFGCDGEYSPVGDFATTSLRVDPEHGLLVSAGQTPFTFCEHIVRIYDPRMSEVDTASISGITVPLTRSGPYYQSDSFICKIPSPNESLSNCASSAVAISGADIELEYNPTRKFKHKGGIGVVPVGFEEVGPLIKEAEEAIHGAGGAWTPSTYGQEVHNRVGASLRGKNGWFVDVWVNHNTNEIFAIDGPPANTTGLTQVDLIRVKPGYHPQVGDVLDRSKIENVFDIKTGLSGGMSGDQKARLRSVRGDDIVIAKSKYRVKSGSLELNPKFKVGFRALGIIGAGLTAYAWINYSNYDDQLLAIVEKLEHAKRIPSEDMKRVALVEVRILMQNYLSNFVDTTILSLQLNRELLDIMLDEELFEN